MASWIFSFILQERNKQIQRIRSIFHRHLSVPLENLSSTLIAYKTWELEQGIDLDIGSDDLSKVSHQVAVANKKAQQMYSERAHLEENISKQDLSDTEKFQEFMVRIVYRAVDIYHKCCVEVGFHMPTISAHIVWKIRNLQTWACFFATVASFLFLLLALPSKRCYLYENVMIVIISL